MNTTPVSLVPSDRRVLQLMPYDADGDKPFYHLLRKYSPKQIAELALDGPMLPYGAMDIKNLAQRPGDFTWLSPEEQAGSVDGVVAKKDNDEPAEEEIRPVEANMPWQEDPERPW